jgi:pimeloyl-ACP methyl ester carboxylesterase
VSETERPDDRGKRAVVFIHGISGGARMWSPQLASFAAEGFAPVALDLPGYGDRPPVANLDFETLAADVEEAVTRLRIERPVLVGHSMGGMVVQTMLRRQPNGYAAAVLACTSPAFGNPSGDFPKRFVAGRLAPLDAGGTMADLAETTAAELTGPHADAAARALVAEAIAATPAVTYRAAVHCLVGFDERQNLGAIRIPILCLAGEHDRNAPPAVMERMAARIPGAGCIRLGGVGHFPNLEAPRAHDAAVFDFVHHALEPLAQRS